MFCWHRAWGWGLRDPPGPPRGRQVDGGHFQVPWHQLHGRSASSEPIRRRGRKSATRTTPLPARPSPGSSRWEAELRVSPQGGLCKVPTHLQGRQGGPPRSLWHSQLGPRSGQGRPQETSNHGPASASREGSPSRGQSRARAVIKPLGTGHGEVSHHPGQKGGSDTFINS